MEENKTCANLTRKEFLV